MMESDIRNEEKLLLRLCRLSFNEEQIKEIHDLVQVITDWKYFTYLSIEHGVSALIYNNLEKNGLLQYITSGEVLDLKESLMKSMTRNAFHTGVLYEVLSLFNRENIKTTLLKGMALELNYYGNSGLRQMTDIDILLSRENCIKAKNILSGSGFVSLPVKSAFHKLIIPYTGKHLPTMFRNGASVEIHHELFGRNSNLLASLLAERGFPIKIKDQTAFIPDPQLFFLYLTRHIWIHELNNESQLRLYTDLVVLLENHLEQIISPRLLTFANEAGMADILGSKLELLRNIWGVSFPETFNQFINERHNPQSISRFRFFLKSPKSKAMSGGSDFYRQIIKDIPGVHRKFIYILGDLFPSISFMKKRYKCKSGLIALLYYPHRAGKLLLLLKSLIPK
jgi:hypothetical protein